MNNDLKKKVMVPIDGSRNALKALDYIHRLLNFSGGLVACLYYVVPTLPPVMIEESRRDRQTARQLKRIEANNQATAKQYLDEAAKALRSKGVDDDRIEMVFETKRLGIARDICAAAEERMVDALVISGSGKGRLEAFFMGEVTNKVIELMKMLPVWVVKGSIQTQDVLVAFDGSENAMRAVDHAAFMLARTSCRITLFHSKRSLARFIPMEAMTGSDAIERTWFKKAGQDMEPKVQRARQMLMDAGVSDGNIHIKIVDGSRKPARDIMDQAKHLKAQTIVMGRRGATDAADFSLGSISRKVLNDASDMAVWLVA